MYLISTLVLLILYTIIRGLKKVEYSILIFLLLFYISNNVAVWLICISCIILFYVFVLDIETIVLFLTSIVGLFILIQTNNLIELYISLEAVGLTFYVLVVRDRRSVKSTESGLKYFILGALSSGLILFGVTLVYAQTGTLDLVLGFNTSGFELSWVILKMGLLFKLGAAPFHTWIPDIYEGSPIIVMIFLAIVPKIAYISILIRISLGSTDVVLLISGLLSIFIGAIGALNQNKIKRLIGYSAIGHTGYLLVGISTGLFIGFKSAIIYLIIYIVTGLNFLILVNNLGVLKIIELRGLARRNGMMSFTLGLILMSIGGLPPLAGFYSKYLILCSLLSLGYIFLTIFAISCSVIGIYYYLNILRWIYFEDNSEISIILNPINFNTSIILGLNSYGIVTILFYPNVLEVFSLGLAIKENEIVRNNYTSIYLSCFCNLSRTKNSRFNSN